LGRLLDCADVFADKANKPAEKYDVMFFDDMMIKISTKIILKLATKKLFSDAFDFVEGFNGRFCHF